MELRKIVCQLCFFLSSLLITGYGHDERVFGGGNNIRKLFVFGDSYADTGNNKRSESSSWKVPYGLTFPGKPAGRFSDGRVLTDYLSSIVSSTSKYLGMKSPIPYEQRKSNGGKGLQYGMNFAYGGTGVFDTLYMAPNMTTQIDFLQNILLNGSLYTKADLDSSLVLVTLSGNDYASFLAKGGTSQGLQGFIGLVVNQLVMNLKRIREMGARKVMVTALQPLGCLPRATAPSWYQQCDTSANTAVKFHNLLLQQAVANLNNDNKTTSTTRSLFTILDLYTSFATVLNSSAYVTGKMKFETPLKPCCMGFNKDYSCGSTDGGGLKLYSVCDKPDFAFFWDNSHPTQAGWDAIFWSLKPTLNTLFYY